MYISSLFKSLEIQFAVDTEDTVRAGEGVTDAWSGGGYAVVVLIVRLEIASTELYVFVGAVFETEANAAGVDYERHVVHVGISELVAGNLGSCRDGEALGDISLGTAEVLVGAAVEQLLCVVIPMGLGVVEVVITQV